MCERPPRTSLLQRRFVERALLLVSADIFRIPLGARLPEEIVVSVEIDRGASGVSCGAARQFARSVNNGSATTFVRGRVAICGSTMLLLIAEAAPTIELVVPVLK